MAGSTGAHASSKEWYEHLLTPTSLQALVRAWLTEDTPSFDYGGCVVGDRREQAVLLCKSPGVLCGRPFVDAVFSELGCSVEWLHCEGEELRPICEVARVSGPARRLLLGERVALNCMARASGVATAARRLAEIKRRLGWKGQVVGTRKTTPGFRLVEKYALLVGGIGTHRHDLSSMVMLKDNHIWSVGGIQGAVHRARQAAGFSIKIEVECRSVDEARSAAQAGADVVMLDNFTPKALGPASRALKSQFPQLLVEASGGVKETTLPGYMIEGVDVISMSAPTQGYKCVDFSLKVRKPGRDPRNPKVTSSL